MTQKFEIITGKEEDFDGAQEWATFVTESKSGYRFFSDDVKFGAKIESGRSGQIGKMQHPKCHSIIAERRPITEPQPDSDGWIEWKGGVCPVEKDTLVDVKFRNGRVNLKVKALEEGSAIEGGGGCQDFWDHDESWWDIIAYRLSQSENVMEPSLADSAKDEVMDLNNVEINVKSGNLVVITIPREYQDDCIIRIAKRKIEIHR